MTVSVVDELGAALVVYREQLGDDVVDRTLAAARARGVAPLPLLQGVAHLHAHRRLERAELALAVDELDVACPGCGGRRDHPSLRWCPSCRRVVL